jgi:hypothetical protein
MVEFLTRHAEPEPRGSGLRLPTRRAAPQAHSALRAFACDSRSASPAPSCEPVAFTTSRAGRNEHIGPGGRASPPPNGSGCLSRPPLRGSNSAGVLTVSRSDNGK